MKIRFAGLLCAVGAVIALAGPGFSQKKEMPKVRVVIAAAATSYGEGASSVVCLLDETCKGFWTPMSRDGGVNEGIYIQFREPSVINGIDVVIEGDAVANVSLKPYFDGMTGGDAAMQQYRRDKADREKAAGAATDDQLFITTSYDELAEVTHFQLHPQRDNYNVKSVFLKLNNVNGNTAPRVQSIRFYDQAYFGEDKKIAEKPPCRGVCREWINTLKIKANLSPITLPVFVRAHVSATSTLSPAIAYGPEHLFDSQADVAWSTDGSKSNGVGESLTLLTEGKHLVQGLMLWNGYQRSEAHYKANGRIKTLEINGQIVSVKDVLGIQELHFEKPLEAERITLIIKEIYKGAAYKDVLISELRFVTSDDQIILPQVEEAKAILPDWAAPLQDATYGSFIRRAYLGQEMDTNAFCSSTSLRLRSNGSFVIYAAYLDGKTSPYEYSPGVIEGNWEVGKGAQTLRLFGKKYRVSSTEESDYLAISRKAASLPGPRIFQSQLGIARFNDLSEKEQRNILSFLVSRRMDPLDEGDSSTSVAIHLDLAPVTGKGEGNEDRNLEVTGKSLDAALTKLLERARKLNPIFVKSDVYTELLIPQGKLRGCFY